MSWFLIKWTIALSQARVPHFQVIYFLELCQYRIILSRKNNFKKHSVLI
jgi:hypothetical protein